MARALSGLRAGLRGRGAAPPDIVFGKVDTEAEQELAAAVGIRSIPTLMAFRDGVLVFAQPGALPAEALEDLVTAVQGLDIALHQQRLLRALLAKHASDQRIHLDRQSELRGVLP